MNVQIGRVLLAGDVGAPWIRLPSHRWSALDKVDGQEQTVLGLTTVDKSPMTVHYGTRAHGEQQDHTGTQVRVAAQGPQSARVAGVTDQTDLFHTMARALGIE